MSAAVCAVRGCARRSTLAHYSAPRRNDKFQEIQHSYNGTNLGKDAPSSLQRAKGTQEGVSARQSRRSNRRDSAGYDLRV